MAYFAIRCVFGRELLVKSYIEAAIRNSGRTDVSNIIVPSQNVLDLNNATNNRTNAEFIISYRSYIFVSIESQNNDYEEMSGDLYAFLNKIPNVIQVMTTNVAPCDVKWLEEKETTLVAFGLDTTENAESVSMLTKVKEIIKQNKIISTFKRFVHSFSQSKNKGLSYTEYNGKMIIFAPIELVIEASVQTNLIMKDLLNSPIKLLYSINLVVKNHEICH